MMRRKLQELNLLDDFLFGKLVTYPGMGEQFCRQLISVILGAELKRVKIVPQKVYYGADVDMRGARLDVYIEEEEKELSGTLFDFEPDKSTKAGQRKFLPKRARFYHAVLDQECLKSGEEYEDLKRVVVILMMPYDPFGYDHMVYTIRNRCEELPDMPYDDGAKTIFLYTKGKKGNPSRQLRELLHYMEDSKEENACNDTLKDIHKMVTKVKHNKEVSIEYMKIFEREKMIYEDGLEQGIEKGIRILIADNLEFGIPIDKIKVKLQKNFEVSEMKAQEYLDAYFAMAARSDKS